MAISFERSNGDIIVSCDYWAVTHRAGHGGAWTSIVFTRGSGQNFLTQPPSAMVRFVEPDPDGGQNGIITLYRESNDTDAELTAIATDNGGVCITAEGVLRQEDGTALPLRFKRVYTYNRWGVVYTDLELKAIGPIEGVVEVCALDLYLREGINKAFVRHHPMLEAGIVGGRGYLELPRESYTNRYTPSQIMVYEQDVEGIDIYAPSDIQTWDIAGSDALGLYEVRSDGKGGTYVGLNPYCMAFRRKGMTLNGTYNLRLIFCLPFIKSPDEVFNPTFHAGMGSHWPADEDIREAAEAGVSIFRFHNDYREDGPFWHDGMYPPYDDEGMEHLRRIVDTVHRCGGTIAPYVSFKEFHPESPGYAENRSAWHRQEDNTASITHTYTGSGEFGGLMCMKSGWLDFRKQACEIMLKDIPWDGLYFDWTEFLPCRHPEHAGGHWHTDSEEFIDFLIWSRERVGEDGLIITHNSSHPSMVAENVTTQAFISEHIQTVPEPDGWHDECRFIPVAGRWLAIYVTEEDATNMLSLSGMLEGHMPAVGIPMAHGRAKAYEKYMREFRLFSNIDRSQFRFKRAALKPVNTGNDSVWASLYWKEGEALIYLANLADDDVQGAARIDLSAYEFGKADFTWGRISADGKGVDGTGTISDADLIQPGLEYQLEPWRSILIRLRPA